MFRIAIEALLTIAVVLIARAVLTSILGGIARASTNSFGSQPSAGPQKERPASSGTQPAAPGVGELHKDPVCGTYVAESSPFRRQAGGQTFYYCSEACREKHSLVAH